MRISQTTKTGNSFQAGIGKSDLLIQLEHNTVDMQSKVSNTTLLCMMEILGPTSTLFPICNIIIMSTVSRVPVPGLELVGLSLGSRQQ